MVLTEVGVYRADEFSNDSALSVKGFDLQEFRLASTNAKAENGFINFMEASEWC